MQSTWGRSRFSRWRRHRRCGSCGSAARAPRASQPGKSTSAAEMGPVVYRGMDQSALDAAYDNTSAVKNSAELLAGFDARSEALRAAHPSLLDLRYGPRERNRIDYFAAGRPGPLLVFIHGGYWQMRRKETFSFLAEGPLAHGIHVAFVGYTL